MSVVLERDEQLGRLQAALDSVTSGRGRAVFVGGEAGIGKSALVEHFADLAGGRALVAFGRCDALGTPRAMGPFVDIAATVGADPSADRDVVLANLVALVRADGPVVLVVEDAHWADDATIDLVAMLGRRASDLPLLLVVTYREDEVGAGHPLRQALGNLATTSAATWIGLDPLSLGAVRQLAEPRGVSAEEVYALTGGNPFYVTEVLATERGLVPTSVRLAVLARASHLPPPARMVLDAAAVVPGRCERWLLDALCAASEGDVDECLAAGVLLAEGDTYAFRHELARRAIEHELSPTASRQLHGRAMEALANRPGSDPARVAHHAARAGDDGVLASASASACRLALARGSTREAIDHGERALGLVSTLSADDAAELKSQLSAAFNSAGRAEDAIRLATESVEHWRARGDVRREAAALNMLGTPLVARGHTAEGMALAARAVRMLENEPPGGELANAYLRLTSLHMLDRDRDTAVVWGERAIALAGEVGDQNVLGRALIESGIADVMDNRFDGLDRVRRGIAIGRKHEMPAVVALGLSQIGSGCGELRRYDLAVPSLDEGLSFAAEHDLGYIGQYMRSWMSRCCFDLGRWDDAEDRAAEVLGIPPWVGIARFVALNTLGWLRARRGDGDVWPLLDEALDFARQTGHLQRLWPAAVARAEAGWLEGAIEPHVALLEEAADLAERCRHHLAAGELALWYEQQRQILTELVEVLSGRAPHGLDPVFGPLYKEAPDDAARLRVVIDQVACLTDPAALQWHRELTAKRA